MSLLGRLLGSSETARSVVKKGVEAVGEGILDIGAKFRELSREWNPIEIAARKVPDVLGTAVDVIQEGFRVSNQVTVAGNALISQAQSNIQTKALGYDPQYIYKDGDFSKALQGKGYGFEEYLDRVQFDKLLEKAGVDEPTTQGVQAAVGFFGDALYNPEAVLGALASGARSTTQFVRNAQVNELLASKDLTKTFGILDNIAKTLKPIQKVDTGLDKLIGGTMALTGGSHIMEGNIGQGIVEGVFGGLLLRNQFKDPKKFMKAKKEIFTNDDSADYLRAISTKLDSTQNLGSDLVVDAKKAGVDDVKFKDIVNYEDSLRKEIFDEFKIAYENDPKAINRLELDNFVRSVDEVNAKGIKKKKFKVTGKVTELEDIPNLSQGFDTFGFRYFNKLGQTAKNVIWNPLKKSVDNFARAEIKRHSELVEMNTSLNIGPKESERIFRFGVGLEEGGQEIIEANGKAQLTWDELASNEKQYYNFIRDKYDAFIDNVNSVRVQNGEELINKRENYLTHIIDDDFYTKDLGLSVDELDNISRQIGFKFTKRQGATNILFDATSAFDAYSHVANRYINMSTPIKKINTLIEGKHLPENVAASVRSLLDNVVGKNQIDEGFKSQFGKERFDTYNKIIRNVGTAILGRNLRTYVTQYLSIPNILLEVKNPKHIMVAAARLTKNPSYSKFIDENAQVLAGRQFEIMEKMTKQGVLSKWNKNAFKGIQAADTRVARLTWASKYESLLSDIKSGKITKQDAFDASDEAVMNIQGDSSAINTAPMLRSKAFRVITQFQTFVTNEWDRFSGDVKKLLSPSGDKKKAAENLFYTYLAWDITNAIGETVGIGSIAPSATQTAVALYEGDARRALSEQLQVLPVIGSAISFSKGKSVFGESPVIKTVNDLFEDGSVSKKILASATLLGVSGTSQFKRLLDTVKVLDSGKAAGRNIPVEQLDALDAVKGVLFGIYNNPAVKTTLDPQSLATIEALYLDTEARGYREYKRNVLKSKHELLSQDEWDDVNKYLELQEQQGFITREDRENMYDKVVNNVRKSYKISNAVEFLEANNITDEANIQLYMKDLLKKDYTLGEVNMIAEEFGIRKLEKADKTKSKLRRTKRTRSR